MRNKITRKIYYRITFRLASALSVGSGENQYSDSDVIRNSAGEPFVPGSALAGIYRSLLKKEDAEHYFGAIGQEERASESRVLVYDARLCTEEKKIPYRSMIRDGVGLDEWKTVKPGCKFDFEAIEPGAEFVTCLEQNWEEGDRDIGREIAALWKNSQIRIGRKTMRGLGSVEDVAVFSRSFALDQPKELDAWLDFDMYREDDWKGALLAEADLEGAERKDTISLEMALRQRGGISVRRYTTKVSESGETSCPDAEQLTYVMTAQGEELPYIPGTSWAGAFRHHMERLCPGCTAAFFGSVGERSKIRFSESFIEGAEPKVITRNAVDRFTGGVIENALFTEKTWYGGRTVLRLEIPRDLGEETALSFRQALAASLTDLHMGVLAVGGLTAVGRGIFEGEKLRIDGEEVPVSESMYGKILEKLEGK
jgi:CRISPR/Cas system CSM-associated protein Csm3 (group 7 of RAMP superfamily)|nr:RAMP superfamily CRISPR-associated protein [uncultured Acetatifactor sp.]